MSNVEMTRDSMLSVMSDVYKTAYGSRPTAETWRGWLKMSMEQLEPEFDRLLVAADVAVELERSAQSRAEIDFETTIAEFQNSYGISREDALRWYLDAELTDYDKETVEQYGPEYLDYKLGFSYGYSAKAFAGVV